MIDKPTAACVIVSYRTPALTELAVRSATADEHVHEIVVVDNASGDDTLDRLAALGDSRLATIANGANAGFAAAANVGAGRATSDVLIFVNSDAELRPGAVAQLLAELAQHDSRAIVGPKVVEPSGAVQRSAGLLPRPSDLVVRALGLHRLAIRASHARVIGDMLRRSSTGTEYDTAISARTPVQTSMISGSCLAIGRGAFEELQGFDDRYFMYFEDADLSRRAAAASMPIVFVPGAEVRHVGGASSTGDYHFGPLHGPAMVVYLRRWYGHGGAVLALALLAVRATASTIASRPGSDRSRLALVEGIRACRRGRSRPPRPRSVPRP